MLNPKDFPHVKVGDVIEIYDPDTQADYRYVPKWEMW